MTLPTLMRDNLNLAPAVACSSIEQVNGKPQDFRELSFQRFLFSTCLRLGEITNPWTRFSKNRFMNDVGGIRVGSAQAIK
jgi:hypothetical protein